jgi:hypothetical protein
MLRPILLTFCFLLVFNLIQSKTQVIPASRMIDWSPGIAGGIPNIPLTEKNVLDFKADPTGVTDSKAAFVSAINGLPSAGGVVIIPAGTYKIGSTITISKSNVVFRGEGVGKTRLMMDFSGDCFSIAIYGRGEWQNITADIVKGTNQLEVTTASLFKVGDFAEIQQENDPEIMYTNPEWNQTWAENSVGQLFEIGSISGNLLKFKTSTHINFQKRLNIKIRPQKLIKNVGFEKFYLEKKQAGGYTFNFTNAAYCWIQNIESNHTRKSHVYFAACIGCVVRDSYFHHSFDYGGGGSGYGIECAGHSTDNLIENNIFNHLRHAMMVQLGANGNVFGYNYSINAVQGEGETNLNVDWTPPDISIHGHYAFMNLFEGNDVQEIGIGDFWGPAGPGNTFLRNRVAGEGIFYYDHSSFQNLLGNQTLDIQNEKNTSVNLLEHGNVINSKVKWNDTITDRNLPNSLYLKTMPTFLDGKSWPAFGPGIQNGRKLPAQIRYESIKTSSQNPDSDKDDLKLDIRKLPYKSGILIGYNLEKENSGNLSVYQIDARLVCSQNLIEQTGSFVFNPISTNSNGIYFVRLSTENAVAVRKFILSD